MPRKKVVHQKTCIRCTADFECTDSRRTYCDFCRKTAEVKHRHGARAAKLPKMFQSNDGEGRQISDEMFLMTFSYGREDGSSATHTSYVEGGPKAALMWLIDQTWPKHKAGDQEFRNVPVAFHFNWDTAVIAKEFDPTKMFLIRKAQTKIKTALCGSTHKGGQKCPMKTKRAIAIQHLENESRTLKEEVDELDEYIEVLHRYDPADIEKVITNGGEGDIIAYDRESQLAIATSPKRRFYVEHRPNGDRFEGWRRVDIHDTGTAFAGGLEKVIESWNPELTEQQREVIRWGKKHRKNGTFDMDVIDKIKEYSEAECVAHARVCRILLQLIKEVANIEIKETELFGSGSIAGAVLKHYWVPRRNDSKRYGDGADLTHEDVAQLTYFGGMIETPVVGLVQGEVDEVDINSAHPHKMVNMPCMRKGCGEWVTHDTAPGEEILIGHVEAKWMISKKTSTPPFILRREDGRVGMPWMMNKWTWVSLAEYQAAVEEFGYRDIKCREVVYWKPDCTCGNPKPFKFLEKLYNERLAIKSRMKRLEGHGLKESSMWWKLSVQEQAIKLIINSVYGKLAQQDPMPGAFTNLHFASYITGATRAQVRRETWAREKQGGTVVYQHTDSVLSQGGKPVDGGKELGAWGMEKKTHDFMIMQPGLATSAQLVWVEDEDHEHGGYWKPKGKTASRGCRMDVFIESAIKYANTTDLTKHPTEWPKMVTKQKVMVSRRQALAWGKPHLAGSFQDKVTEISPVSPKRDIENAYQMPGCPTAWIVPPLDYIENPATLEDVLRMRGHYRKKREAGEYDA